MSRLELRLETLGLSLLHPFTIARGTEETVSTVVVRLRWDGLEGLGETVPMERYGESIESVVAFLRDHRLPVDDPYLLDELLSENIPPAARCALDIALHDLVGKDCGKPLYRLLGLDGTKTPITSFTIGICDIETMLQRLAEIRDHPILKLKLGTGSVEKQVGKIEAVRSRYTGAIRVDANEGCGAR